MIVWLLVFALVCVVVFLLVKSILSAVNVAPKWSTIILCLLGLIAVAILVQHFGWFAGPIVYRR